MVESGQVDMVIMIMFRLPLKRKRRQLLIKNERLNIQKFSSLKYLTRASFMLAMCLMRQYLRN